jgi:hypothetical protein
MTHLGVYTPSLIVPQDAFAIASTLMCPFYKDFWTLGKFLAPNQWRNQCPCLVAVPGYPKKNLKNPSRMDGLQYLEFYFYITLPYGLQKYGIPS